MATKARHPNTEHEWHPSNAAMHAAVESKDAGYNGVFWIAVASTGVVCLPSCSARTPKPANRRFYLALEDALRDGFRPCRRCRPERYAEERDSLIELARFIADNSDQKLTMATLARRVDMTPATLTSRFRGCFGVTPGELQDHQRMQRFRRELQAGASVLDALLAAGYPSTSQIYESRYRSLGMTPGSYRDGAAEETIHYASCRSHFGPLLLAATARGVCFAQFGESIRSLVDQLKTEFPHARIKRAQPEQAHLNNWLTALSEHLRQNAPRPDLPLDLRGTAFQLRTWRFLLSVESGQTLSYSELAAGISRPSAVRAAATACAANRIAVLVPCHRVLSADGSLGGYRWGVERKRDLLAVEAARSGEP